MAGDLDAVTSQRRRHAEFAADLAALEEKIRELDLAARNLPPGVDSQAIEVRVFVCVVIIFF